MSLGSQSCLLRRGFSSCHGTRLSVLYLPSRGQLSSPSGVTLGFRRVLCVQPASRPARSRICREASQGLETGGRCGAWPAVVVLSGCSLMQQILGASAERGGLRGSFYPLDQRLVKVDFVIHLHLTLQGVIGNRFRALEAAREDRTSSSAAVQSTCVMALKPRKRKQR